MSDYASVWSAGTTLVATSIKLRRFLSGRRVGREAQQGMHRRRDDDEDSLQTLRKASKAA